MNIYTLKVCLRVTALVMFFAGTLRCKAEEPTHETIVSPPEAMQINKSSALTNNLQPVYVQKYKVRDGENLYDVAIRWGASPSRIEEHNHLTNLNLRAGMILEIPEGINTGATSREVPSAGVGNDIPPVRLNMYVVKEGEDLLLVAIRWGVSPSRLKEYNHLTNLNLRAGMILELPEDTNTGNTSREVPGAGAGNDIPPVSLNTYVVKEGEDLYDVAIRFGVSPTDLKAWNNLDKTKLRAGKLLRISNEGDKCNPPWALADDVDEGDIPPASSKTYVAKEGEDLYGVAIRFGVNQVDIRRLNKLTNLTFKAGQVLKLPVGHNEDDK